MADQIELVDAATTPLNPDQSLVDNNPLGKLPTMILDDGHVLFDSRVICEYLDSIHDGEKLIPESGMERMNALVTQSLGDGIMDAAVATRYETFLRPEEKQWDEWVEGQMTKVQQSLDVLERWRGAKLPEMHIGSISVAAALGYLEFRFTDLNWREGRPVLTQMYETFSKRTSMVESDPQKV